MKLSASSITLRMDWRSGVLPAAQKDGGELWAGENKSSGVIFSKTGNGGSSFREKENGFSQRDKRWKACCSAVAEEACPCWREWRSWTATVTGWTRSLLPTNKLQRSSPGLTPNSCSCRRLLPAPSPGETWSQNFTEKAHRVLLLLLLPSLLHNNLHNFVSFNINI